MITLLSEALKRGGGDLNEEVTNTKHRWYEKLRVLRCKAIIRVIWWDALQEILNFALILVHSGEFWRHLRGRLFTLITPASDANGIRRKM